jgi:integrating conjugative element protein (TIGR03757 family)
MRSRVSWRLAVGKPTDRVHLMMAVLCVSAITPSVHAQRIEQTQASSTTQDWATKAKTPSAQVSRIEVFTDSSILLKNTQGASVYLLDGLKMLEEHLSQGLPGNAQEAEKIARQRIQALGVATLKERANNAAEGLRLAQKYGIKRLPAIVINAKTIVYGLSDVAQAVDLYAGQMGQGARP